MAEKKKEDKGKGAGDGDAMQAKLEEMKAQLNALTGALQSKNVEVANVSSELAEFRDNKLKMLLNIKELKEQLAQQKNDTTDIYYFLNKKCDDSYDIISSLETQLLNEQTDREINEKLYEARISELESNLSHERKSASDKITEMENKINTLLNFQSMKEAFEAKVAQLQAQMETERADAKIEISFLEQKLYKEKVRLQEEMEERLADVEEDVNSKVRERLSADTVKVHSTNEKISKELHYQSKNTLSIIKRGESILEGERKLRLELALAKDLEVELLSKLGTYSKLNQRLNDNLQEARAAADSQERGEAESRALHDDTVAALREEVSSLSKVIEEHNAKRNELINFLLVSYEIVKKKDAKLKGGAAHSLSSPGRPTRSASDSSNNGVSEGELQAFGERDLLALVKSLLLRFPRRFKGIFLQYYRDIINSITSSSGGSGELKVEDMDSPRGPDYHPSLITQLGNQAAGSGSLPPINASPGRRAPRDYSLFLDSPPSAGRSDSAAHPLSPKVGKQSTACQTEARLVLQEGGLLWLNEDAETVGSHTTLTSGGVATFPNRRHAAANSGDSVGSRSIHSTSDLPRGVDVLSPSQEYLIENRKRVQREKKELKLRQRSLLQATSSELSPARPAYPAFNPPVSLRRPDQPKRGRVTDAALSGAAISLSGSSTPMVSLREYEKMRGELSKIARDFGSTKFNEAFSLADGPVAGIFPMSDDEGEEEEVRSSQPLVAVNFAVQRRADSGSSELTHNTRLTDSISPRSDLTQSPRPR